MTNTETKATETYYAINGELHVYQTGEYLRSATDTEERASIHAAERDGGSGVITADDLEEPARSA